MQRFPLTWPTGWRRFPPHLRKRAKFNSQSDHRMGESIYHRRAQVSVCDAVERVFDALSKMGIIDAYVTISSNLQLRNDGLPRSGQPEPSDPGVAVYWREPRSDARKVMAIDRYDRCADNLAAIAASLEAMRAIERHGGAEILDRAFTGFTALPAPDANNWRSVMGYAPSDRPSLQGVSVEYRRLCRERHPDVGGSHEAMAALNSAWEQAQKELR